MKTELHVKFELFLSLHRVMMGEIAHRGHLNLDTFPIYGGLSVLGDPGASQQSGRFFFLPLILLLNIIPEVRDGRVEDCSRKVR